MNYLVLRGFRTYGRWLQKGDIVEESQIRSPRIKRSEGKIIPAVSSSLVTEEFGTEDVKLPVSKEDENINAESKEESKTLLFILKK